MATSPGAWPEPGTQQSTVVSMHTRRTDRVRLGPPQTPRQGLDYTYANFRPGRTPVRWDTMQPVLVRLVDGDTSEAQEVVRTLCRQLTSLTSLALSVGEDLPTATAPKDVEDNTIAVAFVGLDRLAGLCRRHPRLLQGRASGYCVTRIDRRAARYTSAFVAVLSEPNSSAADAIRDLRHQLGHALGLAHGRTGNQLMCPSPLPGIEDYTKEDEWALLQLYSVASVAVRRQVICSQD